MLLLRVLMKTPPSRCRCAFTLLEVLVIVTVGFLMLFALLPVLAQYQLRHRRHDYCAMNLKQIGTAFRVWQGDNNDKLPMDVPVALGGAQEMIATGNVVDCFQVMSNELATPKLLVCSMDQQHVYPTNFGPCLTITNISYFLALHGTQSPPQTILSGDDNLLQNDRLVSPGIINLAISMATWTNARHHGAGNILLMDGSVQTVAQIGFVSSPGTWFATNRIVIP